MFEMDDEFVELSADVDGERPDHVGVNFKILPCVHVNFLSDRVGRVR